MSLEEHLSLAFTRQFVATPIGRAHVLSQLADAEDNGETQMFDRALALVDDPKLAQLIVRHRADELRHGKLFRDRLAAQGVDPGPLDDELKILVQIDRDLGGIFDRPITDARGVMEAYLLLQVLEERAINQFSMIERAFRPVDAATADVLREVADDERRHLRYCDAIARRYAPSPEVQRETLAHYRLVEARAFIRTKRANMQLALGLGLVPGALARLMWQAIGAINERIGPLPLTRFGREAGVPAYPRA